MPVREKIKQLTAVNAIKMAASSGTQIKSAKNPPTARPAMMVSPIHGVRVATDIFENEWLSKMLSTLGTCPPKISVIGKKAAPIVQKYRLRSACRKVKPDELTCDFGALVERVDSERSLRPHQASGTTMRIGRRPIAT